MRLAIPDSVRMALQVPLRNPGRSSLTALGLAIGVSAFIAMVSFGRGARGSVVSQFETLGSNLMRVKRGGGEAQPTPITMAEVDALKRESTTLAYVVPVAERVFDVTREGRRARTLVRGTTPEFTRVREEPITRGGPFDARDERERAKVCVIGMTIVRALFPGQEPLGAVINVGGSLPCRVIGVFSQRGAAISGSDLDDRIVMPFSTFETSLGIESGLSAIDIRPRSPEQQWAAKQEIRSIMRRLRKLPENDPDNFQIYSPDEVTRVAEQIGGILTGLLAGIAAVSLLVGGIGIMNIQLVSVAERTHEIGIRAALGASPEQILRQFLAEALVLAGIGVSAGVAAGVGVSELVGRQMGWAHATRPDVVIFAAAFGIVVGQLFGYIPAKRAADLDPIEALRRE